MAYRLGESFSGDTRQLKLYSEPEMNEWVMSSLIHTGKYNVSNIGAAEAILVKDGSPSKEVDLIFKEAENVGVLGELTKNLRHICIVGKTIYYLHVEVRHCTLDCDSVVVRTLQPVLGDLDRELERAAETLGASRFQSFIWVVLPSIWPTLLTGVALGFSRAVGEYGSVIFIAGNIPMVSEIAPLMIMTKLEQYQYAEATAIAVVMLLASFALMFGINGLQLWAQRRRLTR